MTHGLTPGTHPAADLVSNLGHRAGTHRLGFAVVIPGTPEVVYKGIYVLGVLVALYVIILFLAGHLPMPRLR